MEDYIERDGFKLATSLIFVLNSGVVYVNTRNYVKPLIKGFSSVFPGAYNSKGYRMSSDGQSVTFRLYCAHKGIERPYCNKKWLLNCAKDTTPEVAWIRVFEHRAKCQHGENGLPQPLRLTGFLREEVADRMNIESNLQLLSSFIREASPTQLKAGNSTVPTLKALQNLRSRKFCSSDLDQDDHIDMVKRSLNNNDFIRNVTSPIFTATLFKESQVRVLKKWYEETPFRRAHLDATGNILRKISGQQNVLHHLLLIQIKVANDKGATPFNLAELISTSQTAHIITDFLKSFLRCANEKSQRKTLWFHEIVTDKSFANIGAILQAFNDMTLSNYLETCWTVLMSEDKSTLKKLVVVRLCSSHTTKTMRDDIRQHFKDKHTNLVVCSMIGSMFNIKKFSDLLTYIGQVLFTFMSPFCGQEMQRVKKECIDLLQILAGKSFVDEDIYEDWIDDGEVDSERVTTELSHGPIYANSKFFKHISNMIDEFKVDDEGSENKFFSPPFAQLFLKHHLSYLPLWTNIMTCLRDENQPRANNGPIENYNGLKKRRVREAAQEIGSFGRIKVGRYVEFESMEVDTAVKKVENKIPARSTPRTSKKRQTQESLSENNIMHSKEQYKKRTPRTTKKFSTFFAASSNVHQYSNNEDEDEDECSSPDTKRFKPTIEPFSSDSDFSDM